ncbi:MAG: hypothetical protein ACK4WH_07695 [Phycisphaerales bacterium]
MSGTAGVITGARGEQIKRRFAEFARTPRAQQQPRRLLFVEPASTGTVMPAMSLLAMILRGKSPGQAIRALRIMRAGTRIYRKLDEFCAAAVPVVCPMIMSNSALGSGEPGVQAPAMVLMGFEDSDRAFLDGEEVFDLMAPGLAGPGTAPGSRDEARAAALLGDEVYRGPVRRRLPASVTAGAKIMVAGVYLLTDWLRDGKIGSEVCVLAVPGEKGMLVHVPWWIAAGMDAPPSL